MSSTDTMRAVNYQGAFKVKVEDVPRPQLEHPDDVIVKVTTSGEILIMNAIGEQNQTKGSHPPD
jgi:hypothetical protein